MKTLRKYIQAGLAACVLAGASMPALAWAPWSGEHWAPAHYEWNGDRMKYFPGVWIQDDYDNEWRMYA